MAVHALVPQCAQPFPTICTMVFLLVKLIEKPAPPQKNIAGYDTVITW